MKFGVLTFGYDSFDSFRDGLRANGHYTVNLGDSTQSIAIRHAYRELGVSDKDVVSINRDSLATYDGDPAVLIMNGVFYDSSFPVSNRLSPIFVGFHARSDVITRHITYFRAHSPIGCRDPATASILNRMGVESFVSGCITLTFPPRDNPPADGRLLIVYGDYAGAFPSKILKFIPPELADTAELVFHRLPVFEFPLDFTRRQEVEKYELTILERYRDNASLVLTPLHHVAAPCIAMGIPVVACRIKNDPRFGFLEQLVPIYTEERFPEVDWAPKPVDVSLVREQISAALKKGLSKLL